MTTPKHDFTVKNLGSATIPSPMKLSRHDDDFLANYVDDQARVIFDIRPSQGASYTCESNNSLEEAGPRERIFFEPASVHAGILTCGGLCPGLNDVIRSIVRSLWHHYGVRQITGFRFGYMGMLQEYGLEPISLTPNIVNDIHHQGGTMLGSSRGNGERTGELADRLEQMGINMLFTIGGDGTQRGALDISRELERRKLPISVVGVPKTIDNDLSFAQKSFGFESAVAVAERAVDAAHVEATGAPNGIGLVKLMGRESGFIAAHTVLANNDVNFVLVPEVPFDLVGENGLLVHLENRLKDRGHAVVLVAEGAGQDLLEASAQTDASGNKKLGDIGLFLKKSIGTYFKNKKISVSQKYIDPSYIIRATRANPNDSLFCARLAAGAVHAAMAGKTEMLISLLHNRYVHVPIGLAVSKRNRIDPDGAMWGAVIEATGQPPLMKNPSK